jgi:hypothetical protein
VTLRISKEGWLNKVLYYNEIKVKELQHTVSGSEFPRGLADLVNECIETVDEVVCLITQNCRRVFGLLPLPKCKQDMCQLAFYAVPVHLLQLWQKAVVRGTVDSVPSQIWCSCDTAALLGALTSGRK